LEDDLDEDSYLESKKHTEEDVDDLVYALAPVSQNSVLSKMIRSQLETERSLGGCIQLVQLGSCKRAGCEYVYNNTLVLQLLGGTAVEAVCLSRVCMSHDLW